jgi:tetratricopeptide (TPR) repeat protein
VSLEHRIGNSGADSCKLNICNSIGHLCKCWADVFQMPHHRQPLPKQIEFASETYLKEDFSIHDAFFKFLMEADESYNDIKSSMVSNLKELREMENDIESYQYLNSIGDSLMINMFSQDGEISGFLNTMFPDWQDGMEEANTLKMIEMHSKAGNDSLLIITAKRHVDSILEGYEEKVKSIKIGQIAKLEFFKEALMINPPPTDTIFNWEDYKNQSIESVVSSLNRDYSNELNQICWYYYEIVDNKDALLEAIAWCQESIRLNSVKENNDTMAHLYMKSGDKSKAIEYQTIALEIAKKEGLDPEQIKYYSDELEKFKAR